MENSVAAQSAQSCRVVALGSTPSRSEVVGRTILPSHGAHGQLRQLEGKRRTRGDAISATRISSSRGVTAAGGGERNETASMAGSSSYVFGYPRTI